MAAQGSCFGQVFDLKGLQGHEFVMSQISELIDSHFPGVSNTSMLIIVLVDLSDVGSKDTLSVGLYNTKQF